MGFSPRLSAVTIIAAAMTVSIAGTVLFDVHVVRDTLGPRTNASEQPHKSSAYRRNAVTRNRPR